MKCIHTKGYRNGFLLLTLLILLFFLWSIIYKPSNDRDWEIGQEQIPFMHIQDTLLTIANMRDFDWHEDNTLSVRYITQTYDLDTLRDTDVIISHFSNNEGIAHIFLSFGFTDGRHIVISVEARREQTESYSPWQGLLRKYEMIYVVGTERDIIGTRTDIRDERVYVYPTIASPDTSRKLFLTLAQEINSLNQDPEFYNTFFNNCTNAITRRVETIADVEFPLSYKTVLPGYYDEILYEMELIPTQLSFNETKAQARIENAQVNRNIPTFSQDIRQLHFSQ